MLVRTLTKAAGKFNFEPGVEIDLPQVDAEELAAGGAVQIVVVQPEVLASESQEDSRADQSAGRTKRRT